MEAFFKDNIYVLFSIVVYYILVSEKPKYIEQRIIILYFFMIVLSIFNILDYRYMLMIFVVCFFVYFEYLIEDNKKMNIIKTIPSKIIDSIYLLIMKYNFVIYCVLLYIYKLFVNIHPILLTIILVILFLKLITKIITNDFETSDFTTIYNTLNKKNFNDYKKLNESQKSILLCIEDKSFLIRKNSYTFISFEFIKYRFDRINKVINKIEDSKNRPHKILYLYKFIKYILKQTILFIKEIKNDFSKIKRYIRGYSTIEMQLIRTVAITNGYEKVFPRKIFEHIYAPLFFKGLKKYYKLNYKTVTDGYFKEFLLMNYIMVAPLMINGIGKPMEEFWKKEFDQMNDSEFLLSILSLSSKLKLESLDYDNINRKFKYYIKKFNIDKEELKQAIDDMKKLCNKSI